MKVTLIKFKTKEQFLYFHANVFAIFVVYMSLSIERSVLSVCGLCKAGTNASPSRPPKKTQTNVANEHSVHNILTFLGL